jgi:hypothetical protein
MAVSTILKTLFGTYFHDETTGKADFEDLITDDVFTVQKTAVDGAATDVYTLWSCKVPFAIQIVEVTINPGAALTANDTNNATLTLGKADGAGGASTAVAALTTNTASGNWVADQFKNVPITAANAIVNDGQILTLKKTVAASGVAVPISHITIRYRRV